MHYRWAGYRPIKEARLWKILKELERFRYEKGIKTVFEDWVELMAIAMQNRIYHSKWESRERRYLEIVRKYTKKDLDLFAELIALLYVSLSQEPKDYLGEVSAQLKILDGRKGQFFTPYSVSLLLAQITFEFTVPPHNEVYLVNEPTCGSGGMIIAVAQVIADKKWGIENFCFIAEDVDRLCAMMAYAQLSMLDISAIVVCGDTLTRKEYDRWYTLPVLTSRKYMDALRR